MSMYLDSDLARINQKSRPPLRYFLGLDLGQAQDYTAVAILEHIPTTPNDRAWKPDQTFHVRYLHRYQLGTSYPTIVEDVGALTAREPLTGTCRIALDATGVGRAVTDIFREAGKRPSTRSYGARPGVVMSVDLANRISQQPKPAPTISAKLHAITITGGDVVTRDRQDYRVPKRDLVGVVQALLQTGRLKIAPELPLAATLTAELENFKATINAGGHDSYGAGADWREGNHDDLVLAVALAAWDAKHGTSSWAWSV